MTLQNDFLYLRRRYLTHPLIRQVRLQRLVLLWRTCIYQNKLRTIIMMDRRLRRATTFAESKFQPDAPSVASSSLGGSSVSSLFQKSRLPLPPRVHRRREYFECPYCCQLVPIKFLQKRHWMLVHSVFCSDTSDYGSTLERCYPDNLFYQIRYCWVVDVM